MRQYVQLICTHDRYETRCAVNLTHERYEKRCAVNLYTWKIWEKTCG